MRCIEDYIHRWWSARYVAESRIILDEVDAMPENTIKKAQLFLNSILEVGTNPQLTTVDPRFPAYSMPQSLLDDNQKIRKQIMDATSRLLQQESDWAVVKDFLLTNHEDMKRLQNRWFAANPGLLLEWVRISDTYSKPLISWLGGQGVQVGDDVIHVHIISNQGRTELKEKGFPVAHDHWDEFYYRDMLQTCVGMLRKNTNVKGVFCDSSWVYSPTNFDIAPDGKQFVAFGFLYDARLVGETLDVTAYISPTEYEMQVRFATMSPRRKQYRDEGVYEVRVMASFYSRGALISNEHLFE